jgi:hypothetical protein
VISVVVNSGSCGSLDLGHSWSSSSDDNWLSRDGDHNNIGDNLDVDFGGRNFQALLAERRGDCQSSEEGSGSNRVTHID